MPEGIETAKLEKELARLTNVKSVNQLSICSMDGLENDAHCAPLYRGLGADDGN